MNDRADDPLIQDPQLELRATYEARVRPFVELGTTEQTERYEEAWRIARTFLADACARTEDHAP